MNAQIRQLQKLLDNTPDAKGRARIERMIAKATRDAQKANAAARKMAREAEKIAQRNRALDTQRKIVAGAICLTEMTRDEHFFEQVRALLRRHAEKRYWFHFPEAFTEEEIEAASAEVEAERQKAAAEARARKDERDTQAANGHVSDDDIRAFRERYLSLGEGRGFVRIHRLREALGWPQAHFDAVLAHMHAAYKVELHGGDPSKLTAEELDQSYRDGSGQQFLTLSWVE